LYPDALGGQSKATAVTNTTGSSATGGASSHAGVAPSYVNSQGKDTHGPHGKNIHEGGFKSDDKHNASFTSDIGDKNDPGRLAELKFERENADSAPTSGSRQPGGVSGEGMYDALKDTSA
jgi:hypothetical protein